MTGDRIPAYLSESGGAVLLQLHVQPRASADRIVGEHDGRLKIQITAPPADNKANKHLVAFLSKKLGVPKSQLEITQGLTSRRKTMRIVGLSVNEVADKIS